MKPKHNYREFERNGRIKGENKRIETRVREKNRVLGLLKFVQGFINDSEVVP